jgi:hypothetical protein
MTDLDMYFYTVRHHRYGSPHKVQVWVGDKYGYSKWSRTVNMKDHWWRSSTGTERLRLTLERAQQVADRLNEKQAYIDHDVESVLGEDD